MTTRPHQPVTSLRSPDVTVGSASGPGDAHLHTQTDGETLVILPGQQHARPARPATQVEGRRAGATDKAAAELVTAVKAGGEIIE